MESTMEAGAALGVERTEERATPSAAARRSATAVGALFLTATACYLLGSGLIDSAVGTPDPLSDLDETRVRLGVLLELVDAAAVVGIGVLLFPILRRHREAMALGYVGTRIVESALLLVSMLAVLLLLPLSQELVERDAASKPQARALAMFAIEGYDAAFQLAMIALGAGSLLLCYVLYEARLVPRVLPVLGFAGYAALFASGWLEIAGHDAASVLYIPGALFELALPLWLIAKGFNPAATTGPPCER